MFLSLKPVFRLQLPELQSVLQWKLSLASTVSGAEVMTEEQSNDRDGLSRFSPFLVRGLFDLAVRCAGVCLCNALIMLNYIFQTGRKSHFEFFPTFLEHYVPQKEA